MVGPIFIAIIARPGSASAFFFVVVFFFLLAPPGSMPVTSFGGIRLEPRGDGACWPKKKKKPRFADDRLHARDASPASHAALDQAVLRTSPSGLRVSLGLGLIRAIIVALGDENRLDPIVKMAAARPYSDVCGRAERQLWVFGT